MENIIEVKNLTKYYGKTLAVDRIDFEVKKGEIFGFLGPNGAGKSTTINMLCTIIGKSDGELYVGGDDVTKKQDEVRKKIGIVFQERTLDEKLTARENLYIHGRLYHIPKKEISERIGTVLEVVGLSDKKKDLVSSFSGGMKRMITPITITRIPTYSKVKGKRLCPATIYMAIPINILKTEANICSKKLVWYFFMKSIRIIGRIIIMIPAMMRRIPTPMLIPTFAPVLMIRTSCVDECRISGGNSDHHG